LDFSFGQVEGAIQRIPRSSSQVNRPGSRDEDRSVSVPQIHQSLGQADVPPKLTIIIVNYNSWPDVSRLVSALAAEPEFGSGSLQIVVVDNASQGPIPGHLLPPPPGLRLLARRDNGGFAVGVNAGWRLAQSPWLLVLNPDVEVEEGWIGQVLEQIERYDGLPSGPPGIVGFGLRNPDSTPQGSVGVFPSLFRTIREQFIPRSRRKYQAGWRIRSGPVDWVTGACMLVNGRMIAELGGMDEDFFLYYEEVAFSRRAHDHGWRVEYEPSICLVHRHPLQNREISPKMRVITRHSKLLYFRKHLPHWQFRALSWMITTEAALKGLGSRIMGHDEDRRAWTAIRAVVSRLRAGGDLRGGEVHELAEAIEARPAGPPGAHSMLHKPADRAEDEATNEPAPVGPVAEDERPA
jgi:GT2 family glycosyltransferase